MVPESQLFAISSLLRLLFENKASGRDPYMLVFDIRRVMRLARSWIPSGIIMSAVFEASSDEMWGELLMRPLILERFVPRRNATERWRLADGSLDVSTDPSIISFIEMSMRSIMLQPVRFSEPLSWLWLKKTLMSEEPAAPVHIAGRVPMREFHERSRYSSSIDDEALEGSNSSGGMLPVRLFDARLRLLTLERTEVRSTGIVPDRAFPWNWMAVREQPSSGLTMPPRFGPVSCGGVHVSLRIAKPLVSK